jgi:hypothetical protein
MNYCSLHGNFYFVQYGFSYLTRNMVHINLLKPSGNYTYYHV